MQIEQSFIKIWVLNKFIFLRTSVHGEHGLGQTKYFDQA